MFDFMAWVPILVRMDLQTRPEASSTNKDLYLDDSFTGGGGFGDIFGPNLDIPECQKDFQCVVVGYNTDAVPFPQCDRTVWLLPTS